MKKLILIALLAFTKVDAQIITTVAGIPGLGLLGDGGPATDAYLYYPTSVAVDLAGNLYITDKYNDRIRKVNTAGIITTVAGNGCNATTGGCFGGDGGQATDAELNYPTQVAVDAMGNLYIGDTYNYRIRKVNTAGIITTIVGNGIATYAGDGGPATAASFAESDGMAFDALGNLYFADLSDNVIRKVNTSGIITTIAGNGSPGFAGDGGPATSAELQYPQGVAFDPNGNLYITDMVNFRIRKINTSGIITTFAGNGTDGYSGDGGQATAAQFGVAVSNNRNGITFDTFGNLYFSDNEYNVIRKINTSGIITTVAGGGTGGDGIIATSSELFGPGGIAMDTANNLYISDDNVERVRKVTNIETVGIKKVEAKNNKLILYPNPASTLVNVSFTQLAQEPMNNIAIYNMLGECVYRQTIASFTHQIDIVNLNAGVYTLEISSANQKAVKQLIKQ